MPSFLKVVEHHVMPLVRHIDQMRERNGGESCSEPELSDTLQDWSASPALPRFLTEEMRAKIVSALHLYGQYDQDFEMEPHHIERLLYGDEERQRQQKEKAEIEQQEKQRLQQQQHRQALAAVATAIEEINKRLANKKADEEEGGDKESSCSDMDVETSNESGEFLSSRNETFPLSFTDGNTSINNALLDGEETLVIDLSRFLQREKTEVEPTSTLSEPSSFQRPDMVESKVLDAINRLERKQQRHLQEKVDVALYRQQREERRKREAEERARNAPLKRYLCRKCKTRNTTFYTAQQRQGPPKTVMECPQCRYRCFVSSSGWDVGEKKQDDGKKEEEKREERKEEGEIVNDEEKEDEESSSSSSSSESSSSESSTTSSSSSSGSGSRSGRDKDKDSSVSKSPSATNGAARVLETTTENADDDSMAE